MNPALVRLSVVVALTVPLSASPALAMATQQQQLQVTVVLAAQAADPTPPVDEHSEHGEHGGTGETSETGETGETTGDHTSTPAPDRPRVLVLSAFGGLNAVVLVSAAVLRRRDLQRPRHRPRAAVASA